MKKVTVPGALSVPLDRITCGPWRDTSLHALNRTAGAIARDRPAYLLAYLLAYLPTDRRGAAARTPIKSSRASRNMYQRRLHPGDISVVIGRKSYSGKSCRCNSRGEAAALDPPPHSVAAVCPLLWTKIGICNLFKIPI